MNERHRKPGPKKTRTPISLWLAYVVSICESHMREIQLLHLECRGVWGPTPPDASLQRLDKARVLILAQLKQQCADLLQQMPSFWQHHTLKMGVASSGSAVSD